MRDSFQEWLVSPRCRTAPATVPGPAKLPVWRGRPLPRPMHMPRPRMEDVGMTPDEVSDRIAAIHTADPYRYYCEFPPLWREVLAAIADGAPDPDLLAAAALRAGNPASNVRKPLLTDATLRSLIQANAGISSAKEATSLGLSTQAVSAKRRNALKKLGARDAAHAIEILLVCGEITEEDLTPPAR